MNAQQFDKQLKEDSLANNFKVEGSYIVFDKTANLSYLITPNFSLRELLTKNPANSYTKLHKSVILKLQRIRDGLGQPITINSSYRDFYYNKRVGGATASQHLKGNAIDCTCKDVEHLHRIGLSDFSLNGGGCGLYDTFLHIDCGEKRLWDSQKKKFDDIEDGILLLGSDEKKDFAIVGVLTLFVFLFFKLIRR